jgi:hypothetical protein
MEIKLLDLIEMVYSFALLNSKAFDCGSNYSYDCNNSLCAFNDICKQATDINKIIAEIRNEQ